MNPYSFSKTQLKCHVPQEVCPDAVSPSFYCSHSPRSSCLMNICIVTGLLMTYHHLGMLSCIRFFATPWTVARQSYLSMEFSRQEYWTGLPFPSPGDLPYPGLEPGSLVLADGFFTVWAAKEVSCGCELAVLFLKVLTSTERVLCKLLRVQMNAQNSFESSENDLGFNNLGQRWCWLILGGDCGDGEK